MILYQNITRQEAAWIVRLRTAHCNLNKYLHRFGHAETVTWECGDSEETVTHYLLWCTKFDREREKLRKEVGIGGMKVEKLLGFPKLIKPLLEFIRATKRLTF